MIFILFSIFTFSSVWITCFLGSILPIDKIDILLKKPNIIVLDDKNKIIGRRGEALGRLVKLSEVPKHFINTLLAAEDKNFFKHIGFDFRGIIRAYIENMKNNKIVQGGSTITQQLSKNFLQNRKIIRMYDKTISRKIKELIVALIMEYKFTKEQILMAYLNTNYYGAGLYGIDAATKFYFNKDISSISLIDSVLISSAIQAPSKYALHMHYDKTIEPSVASILQKMINLRFITEEEKRIALLTYYPSKQRRVDSFQYFIDWIVSSSSNKSDITIHSTLNSKIQKIAEKSISNIIAKHGSAWNMDSAAMVVLSDKGEIKAMIGNEDYSKSQFNIAVNGMRQPGSVFKYFIYLVAMENGYSPDDTISDDPIEINGWSPRNSTGDGLGDVSLRTAFAKSINTCSVRLGYMIGTKKILKLCKKMNIINRNDIGLSIVLGAYETTLLNLAGGLTPMLNDGEYYKPFGIYSIDSGNTNIEHTTFSKRIVSQESIEKMKDIMNPNIEGSTSWRMRDIPLTMYCKTGTSQNYNDLLFICVIEKDQIKIAPNGLIIAIWSGNNSSSKKEIDRLPQCGHLSVLICKEFLSNLTKYLQRSKLGD